MNANKIFWVVCLMGCILVSATNAETTIVTDIHMKTNFGVVSVNDTSTFVDMTAHIVNPQFDNETEAGGAPSGWLFESTPSRPSKISTLAKGTVIPAEQNHWQIGGNSGETHAKAYQTVTHLPDGKYLVQVTVVANPFAGHVWLYANTGKTPIASGKSAVYETTGVVFNGTLEIGLEVETKNSPTLDIDNFKLHYLGMDAQAYSEVLHAKMAAAKTDTLDMVSASGRPRYNNLVQYRKVFKQINHLSDSSAATITGLLPLIDSAMFEYDAILEAYQPLKDAIDALKIAIAGSNYPDQGKKELNRWVGQAQALYDSKQDERAKINPILQQLAQKGQTLKQYKQLEESIARATSLQASANAPQKAIFTKAMTEAKAIAANPIGKDLTVPIQNIHQAKRAYYNVLFPKPAIKQVVSRVDTSLQGSEKWVLRVDERPFYMTNIQVRLDKLKGYLGWNDAALEAVLKRAAADGFNTVSIPVTWREVEPSKDDFDWTTIDRYMAWCKKYHIKMELLWYSWSSGGRIQWLIKNDKTDVQQLRTPDYVCSKEGTSTFTIRRKTDPWTLDWYDDQLRNREKYVLEQVMEHVALWEANNGQPHIIIGVQLGNEAHGHEQEVSAGRIIDYYDYVGAAVKESKYVVWTRLNCVSWMTSGRMKANEAKRKQGGTNIDFVGIDVYGTNAASIRGDVGGQLPHTGKNYSMIMEIDAKDGASPIYQMAALAGNKAFDYYNMAAVDGNQLYTNEGTTLVERPHITAVRHRNKILNLANQDIALKAQGKSLYVYNYAGNSMATETGIEGIRFKPTAGKSQAIAIRRSRTEVVLLVTEAGNFEWPASLGVVSASKGYFDEHNTWIDEGAVSIHENTIEMPETAAVLLRLK